MSTLSTNCEKLSMLFYQQNFLIADHLYFFHFIFTNLWFLTDNWVNIKIVSFIKLMWVRWLSLLTLFLRGWCGCSWKGRLRGFWKFKSKHEWRFGGKRISLLHSDNNSYRPCVKPSLAFYFYHQTRLSSVTKLRLLYKFSLPFDTIASWRVETW